MADEETKPKSGLIKYAIFGVGGLLLMLLALAPAI